MKDFRKHLVKICAITFAVIVVLVGGIFYLSEDINKKIAKIQNLQFQTITNINEIAILSALRPDYNKAKEINLMLNNYFPTKDDMAVNFKPIIDTLAKKSNITALNFAFTGEVLSASEGFIKEGFTLSFNSSYEDFTKFLNDLENNRFITKIISPTISIKEDTNEFNVVLPGQVFSF